MPESPAPTPPTRLLSLDALRGFDMCWILGLAPFLWVGANPIALYLCSGFGFFRIISERLATATPPPYDWIPSAMTFAVMLATAQYLHRRQIFLKV